jgi:hypothetical protein
MTTYSSHLIVIFDRSGSMGEPFQADAEDARMANILGVQESKIAEAQHQLITMLSRMPAEFVTVIPFHSEVDKPISGALPAQLPEIEGQIRSISPGGNTLMAPALEQAVKLGVQEAEHNIFVQYLIITDGLSHTKSKDLVIAGQIPRTQVVNGILIDPTREGENHLKSICAGKGLVQTVASRAQFVTAMRDEAERTATLMPLRAEYSKLTEKSYSLSRRLGLLTERLYSETIDGTPLRQPIHLALEEANRSLRETDEMAEVIQDSIQADTTQVDAGAVGEGLNVWGRVVGKVESLIDSIEHFLDSPTRTRLKVTVAHPRRLSKRFPSPFRVMAYPPDRQEEASQRLRLELEKWDLVEHIDDTHLTPGLVVIARLSSPSIEFSDEVARRLEHEINVFSLIGKPDESCHPGDHIVKLSILDKSSGLELVARTFEVRVVDYAFDHVSRPLLSKIASTMLAVAAVITYALTLADLVDTAFGLTAGTAVGIVAAFIYGLFVANYQHTSTTARFGKHP